MERIEKFKEKSKRYVLEGNTLDSSDLHTIGDYFVNESSESAKSKKLEAGKFRVGNFFVLVGASKKHNKTFHEWIVEFETAIGQIEWVACKKTVELLPYVCLMHSDGIGRVIYGCSVDGHVVVNRDYLPYISETFITTKKVGDDIVDWFRGGAR